MIALSISQKVMIGTALLGGIAGVVGSFAVLRKRALVGDMLAHAALPGVTVAYLLAESRDMIILSFGALVSSLLAVGIMTLIVQWTRTKEDAALGIVLSTFFGLGVVLLSVIQKPSVGGNKGGINSYLFGEPANMLNRDLVLLSLVALVILLLVGLLFKEFKVVCFDSQFAEAQGWPALFLDLTMMASLAVVTIVGLPIVGVVLMAAMIILPAATARLWTTQLHWMLILSGGLGILGSISGTHFGRGLPAGPAIVLASACLFGGSLLFAPNRGVVAKAIAEIRMHRKIARDHLLRLLYEIQETYLPQLQEYPVHQLRQHRAWGPRSLNRLLRKAQEHGDVVLSQNNDQEETVCLTPLGLRRSAERTRAHRLWEMYMMQYANIAPDHVDRDADDVEHWLPESLLLELENQLEKEGRLPVSEVSVPQSPHSLEH